MIIAMLYGLLVGYSCIMCGKIVEIEAHSGGGRYLLADQKISDIQLLADDEKIQELLSYELLQRPTSIGGFYHNFMSDVAILPNADKKPLHSTVRYDIAKYKDKMRELYSWLERDNVLFFDKLTGSEAAYVTKSKTIMDIVREVREFSYSLFPGLQESKRHTALFSLANRFFEFSFSPTTFPLFKTYFIDQSKHDCARCALAVMWEQLAGKGWCCWHVDCLRALEKRFLKGDKIVYLAGGTDVAQLIKHGIYNIKVIDPQLPSQEKYYVKAWNFLFEGSGEEVGIGSDTVLFVGKNGKKVKAVRMLYESQSKEFAMMLSTREESSFIQSKTVWALLDEHENPLGVLTFERRPINQRDLVPVKGKTLLISFNELHFITVPPEFDGWGISPYELDKEVQLFVKQLRYPINKPIMQNMQHAALANYLYLKFISLGSCIN